MAKIDLDELKRIREKYQKQFTELSEVMKALKEDSEVNYNKAKKEIEKYNNTSLTLASVTDRVINKHKNSLNGLKDIHNSLFNIQKISELFRAVYIIRDTEILSDAKNLWDNISVEFSGDLEVVELLNTNTAIERELYYIFRGEYSNYSYIRAYSQNLDNLVKYIDNQIYGLNRLDNLIQKLEGIKFNEMFADGSEGSTNVDEYSVSMSDIDEDDYNTTSSVSKPKAKSRESIKKTRKSRPSLGKRLRRVKDE